ncbi:MAG: hypothetical protein HC859_08025 [Bacteroidia bacterium]|nr:hypothetical protein [Bacteroidia bacterium]
METFNPSPFLTFWNNAMIGGAALMAVAGILYYFYHKVKLASIHSYKGKYDFINEKEIRHYKATFIFFALGALCLSISTG